MKNLTKLRSARLVPQLRSAVTCIITFFPLLSCTVFAEQTLVNQDARLDEAAMRWRDVHDGLERAGDLIAVGKCDDAVAHLVQLEESFPAPYRRIPKEVRANLARHLERIRNPKRDDEPEDPFGAAPSDAMPEARLADLCRELHAFRAAAALYRHAWEAEATRNDKHPDESIGFRLLACMCVLDADMEQLNALYERLHPSKQEREHWDTRLANLRRFRAGETDQALLEEVIGSRDPFYRLRTLQRMKADPDRGWPREFAYEQTAATLASLGDQEGRDAWESKILNDLAHNARAVEKVLAKRCSRAESVEDFDRQYGAYCAHCAQMPEADALCGLLLLRRQSKLQQNKRWAKAAEVNRRIIDELPHTYYAKHAQSALAGCLRLLGDHEAAITEYKKVFEIKWEEKDRDTVFGNIIEASGLHDAARALSVCYEATGGFDEALNWAKAARDTYPYSSSCGLAMAGEYRRADAEVMRLKLRAGRAEEALRQIEERMLDRLDPGGQGDDDWKDLYAMLIDALREQGGLMALETRMDAARRRNRDQWRASGGLDESYDGNSAGMLVAESHLKIRRAADANDVRALWELIPHTKTSALDILGSRGHDDFDRRWEVRRAIEALLATPEMSIEFLRSKLNSRTSEQSWAIALLARLDEWNDFDAVEREIQWIARLDKRQSDEREAELALMQRDYYFAMLEINREKALAVLRRNANSDNLRTSSTAAAIIDEIEFGAA